MKELVEKSQQEIKQKIEDYMKLKMENAKLKELSDASDKEKALFISEKEKIEASLAKEAQEKQGIQQELEKSA